VFILKLLAQLF